MVDFLRANPWCTREEYMWKMSVGQVKLASIDFSHVVYKNRDKKEKPMTAGDWLMKTMSFDEGKAENDLGKQIKV